MADLNIRTTLGLLNTNCAEDTIIITRGASAELHFNLYNKVYNYADIQQLTFLFKPYKSAIKSYKLYQYFNLTSDTTPISTKTYYAKSLVSGTADTYTYTVTEATEDNITTLYEPAGLNEITDNLQVDSHFFYESSGSYDWINFLLTPEETKAFKATCDDSLVEFEVAVRIKASAFGDARTQDGYLVEPQESVKVIDSLFGNI